jgi:hypothetical protein
MNRTNLIAVTSLFALLLQGCSTIIDTHPDGTGPAGEGPIPGPPDGDAISASGDVDFLGSTIRLSSTAPQQTAIALTTAGKPHGASEYVITFTGRILSGAEQPALAIDTVDTQGRNACGLELAGGEFRLVSGAGTEAIGNYSTQFETHRVTLRLAKSVRRCTVTIQRTLTESETQDPVDLPLI